MSERNDGGPAFPRKLPNVEVRPDEALRIIRNHEGMSLRDYFAAKAMQGLLAERLPDHHGDGGEEVLAQDAYMIASAMLSEREN